VTVIRTQRLILRPARREDAEPLHALLSDPVAMRWWSSLPHETLDQTRAWVEGMMAGNAAGAPDFVVEWNGGAIGKAGFWKLPDVGYILHPDAWGMGLAREAVGAAIDHVFAERLTDIVTADVDPENAASIRLLERLGFARTGWAERTWNIGGVWKDSVYYALNRPPPEPGRGCRT
jgi:[ribosomal protein S5]-alanine N-acetyltransferase